MSPRLRRHRLALLSFAAFAAVPAAAQDVVLDTVVVEGQGGIAAGTGGGTGPVDGYVAQTTTSGSKTDTPIIEIPQAISVITTDQLEDRGVQDLGEAIRYTAGISEGFGDNRFFGPVIRGFDSIYSIYLNNFRFSRDFGAIAFEPYGQERIEVIKGPASVLYGQDEPGGIVNLIQKRPTFTNFGEVGVEIGSDDRYVAKADLGGVTTDGMVSWRITSLGRLADDQIDFVTDDRFYVAPTITIAPDADTELTILSSIQYDEGTSPIGLPTEGTLFSNPNGELPRSRYAGEPDFNDAEGLLGTVGYEFRHRFNETFEFRQNLQYVNYDTDYNNLFLFGLDPVDKRTITRGTNVQSEEYSGVAVDTQLETTFATGVLDHTTLLGFDYRHNDQDRSSNFTGLTSTIDIYNPVYGRFVYQPQGPDTVTETALEQAGLYAQDQIRWGGFVGTFGLRHDWAENKNEIDGSARSYDELTGRAGLVYVFDNGIAPYVSYSTSFNPTGGANATQQLLEPTEGEVIEGGVKYQPEGFDALVTASVFEITKTNIPFTDFFTGITEQIGEARSRGFEIEASAEVFEDFSVLAAYAYTDTEVTEDSNLLNVGNQLLNAPEHLASLWVDYTLRSSLLGPNLAALDGVEIGGGVRYVGTRFGDAANAFELSNVTLLDAAIRYETERYRAALNVNNIADEKFVSGCGFFGCNFGEGRSVLGSLTVKW